MYCLQRVKGFLYFRRRIPKDVLPILKVREIKKSLHAKAFKDVKVISKSYSYRLERIITLAKCGMLTTVFVFSES